MSYALKCLYDRPRARQEISLHVKCSGHPHVVEIYDVYANEVQFPGEPQPRYENSLMKMNLIDYYLFCISSRLLVVMELMDGGELFDRIGHHRNFTENIAARYTRQVSP